MPYLTDPDVSKNKQTYRFFVELATQRLDYWGVPEHCQVIDVVVTEPTAGAIKTLVAAGGWLTEYRIVSTWQPCCDAPF